MTFNLRQALKQRTESSYSSFLQYFNFLGQNAQPPLKKSLLKAPVGQEVLKWT